ncbi:MAG: patatin-like phospholipase family protein [Elusimicrobia bacterium]|nr:patatin-like phospholipase family protein [Elusimicrobiota bacterium]
MKKIFFLIFLISTFYSIAFCDENSEIFYQALISLPKDKRPSVGLALSGGGARAFAHVGIIEVLKYASFPIDYAAGTSMGAAVGAFYCAGLENEKLWEFGEKMKERKVGKDFSNAKIIKLMLSGSFIDPFYIRQFADSELKDKKFSDLKIPFACVAMDINTGEKIVFTKGELALAVKASVNLPGIFEPIPYGSKSLVDGGVVEFLPVEPLKDMKADWIVSSVTEAKIASAPKNVVSALMQVIDIRGGLLAKQSKKESDFIFSPEVSDISVSDFNKSTQAAERALIYGASKIDSLKEAYTVYSVKKIFENKVKE